jgi:hypothetical protein
MFWKASEGCRMILEYIMVLECSGKRERDVGWSGRNMKVLEYSGRR